jgi:hypothetical protein
MGALLPNNDAARPVYAQLYIDTPEAALDARLGQNPLLNPVIMLDIQTLFLGLEMRMSINTERSFFVSRLLLKVAVSKKSAI